MTMEIAVYTMIMAAVREFSLRQKFAETEFYSGVILAQDAKIVHQIATALRLELAKTDVFQALYLLTESVTHPVLQ